MLAFAIDHPAPATIILITGDRDYAYAVSILKLRKYQVILVVPSSPHTSPCLESQASLVIDWSTAILKSRTEPSNSTQPVKQPYFDLDATLITKILKELQESPRDDSDTPLYPCSTPSQGTSRLRRVTARDLLEPSNFDSTQDSIRDAFSPGKSTSTGSDTAPEGSHIPKTPSRSRHTSVSTGCTQARSATIVAPSPPMVEQYTPAKDPPPFTAGVSSTSDIADVSNRAKRSLSVLTSLDALELPLHDDRPPSSIIVRSPLDPDQSTRDMPGVVGEPSPPCSHESDCLASPFVLAMARTVLESAPNHHSQTTIKPTIPGLVPTGTLAHTAAAHETPQAKDTAVSIEPDNLTALHFENNKGIIENSIPHGRSEDAPELTNSNHQACVASHTTHSPSSGNVGLQPVDVPPSEHVSIPAASFLGVHDGVDSTQLPAFSCASNRDHVVPSTVSASSSATLSAPESRIVDEAERCQAWTVFKPLIHVLLAARAAGIVRPSRTSVAVDLVNADKDVYQRAGVKKFKHYTALAVKAGIIELGGGSADSWIALHSNWFGFHSNNISSPTFDSAKGLQDPILTAPETPVIERAEITPKFISLIPRAFDVSPNNQLDSASQYSEFQPLIDTLVRIRADGFHQPRRSVVGQVLNQKAYTRAGVSGFKEYILKAAEAQVIQFGGVGGFAWVQLHPDLKF